jgi:hypothetical protein
MLGRALAMEGRRSMNLSVRMSHCKSRSAEREAHFEKQTRTQEQINFASFCRCEFLPMIVGRCLPYLPSKRKTGRRVGITPEAHSSNCKR